MPGRRDPRVVRDRVALTALDVERHVEAPRMIRSDLVEAVDAVGVLAVDVDAGLGARGRARALQDLIAFASATAQKLGRIVDVAGRNLAPRPVGVGDVATEHPAVGKALVEDQRGALVLGLLAAVVQVVAAAAAEAVAEEVDVGGIRLAARQGAGRAGRVARGAAADVVRRMAGTASLVDVGRRERVGAVEDQARGVEDVALAAVGQVEADHELGQQGVLDAEQQLVGLRGREIGIKRVGLQEAAGVRVDVAAVEQRARRQVDDLAEREVRRCRCWWCRSRRNPGCPAG